MGHKSKYDWMLFLISQMAFTGNRTHDFVFTKLTLEPLGLRPRLLLVVFTLTVSSNYFIYYSFCFQHL